MISAFGEILGSADWTDGARPPLSSTHYGLQRRCGAEEGKRSAAFGSPAELASPMRLDSMSAHLAAQASRTAHIKGKAVWEAEYQRDRQCGAKVLPSNLPGKVADMSALAFTLKQSSQNLR